MGPVKNRVILMSLLLVGAFSLRAQSDSLAVDSVVTRIRTLLEEYNNQIFVVDTSEYISGTYDADDFNLQIAASQGACNEIIKLYIRGADVNNFIGKTATPLHYAVSSGVKEAVEILLLLGADPDEVDIYGNTPLVSAVRSGNLEITEVLIRHGASMTKSDRFNSSPLHHAAALGYFYITDMLLYYESPTEIRDNEGNTPLMLGVSYGYFDISDILLRAGADPNSADKKGFTPIMSAAQDGDTLIMRMLTDAGANMYAKNEEGADALVCAVTEGHVDAVRFLLDNGNRWGYSEVGSVDPVKLAEYYGHKEIVRMLLTSGLSGRRTRMLEELTLSAGGMFTSHYLMTGGSVSLTEPDLRAGVILGAAFNPFNQQVLVNGNNDIIYQYRVNSSVVYAGLFKEFRIPGIPGKKSNLSLIPSLSAGYRYYSLFEGTNDKPDNKFCIIPSGELRWKKRSFAVGAGLTYLQTPFYKVSPVWFTLRASFALAGKAREISIKKIRLYNYEQN
jgi:ankyrin repeat protein